MARERENHREDVVGRANVEDTPELLAYYEELERLKAGAYGPWPTRSSPGSRSRNLFRSSGAIATCARMCCAPWNW